MTVPWYMWVFLACMVIAPFDALYLYIKAERRRDRLRRRQGDASPEKNEKSEPPASE